MTGRGEGGGGCPGLRPAASQSGADHGVTGLACLRLTESLADLQVELHEAAAGLGQIPAGPHHRQAARLTQGLVTEEDVQKGLDRLLFLAAKDVVRPQGPEDKIRKTWQRRNSEAFPEIPGVLVGF